MGRTHQARLLALLSGTGLTALLLARIAFRLSEPQAVAASPELPLEAFGQWIVTGACILAALGSAWWFLCTGLALLVQAKVMPKVAHAVMARFVATYAPRAVRTAAAATLGASMSMGALPALANSTHLASAPTYLSSSLTVSMEVGSDSDTSALQDHAASAQSSPGEHQISAKTALQTPNVGMTINNLAKHAGAQHELPDRTMASEDLPRGAALSDETPGSIISTGGKSPTDFAANSIPDPERGSDLDSKLERSESSPADATPALPHVGLIPKQDSSLPTKAAPHDSLALNVPASASETVAPPSTPEASRQDDSRIGAHVEQAEAQQPSSVPGPNAQDTHPSPHQLSQQSLNPAAKSSIEQMRPSNSAQAEKDTSSQATRSHVTPQGVTKAHRAAGTVVVQPGDSLWEIAASLCEQDAANSQIAELWQGIYAANAHVIGDDPDLIFAGMLLNIP